MAYLREGKFEIIAHRGGGLEAPENTLFAFEKILKTWPETIIELDVHRTRDGQIVVFHDNQLSRVTDGQGIIWQTPLARLRPLDAAHFFSQDRGQTFPLRQMGIGISLLSEVVEKLSTARISVEFKHPIPFFGDQVVEIIRRAGAQDRVALAGADHENLVRTSALAPEMCSGFSKKEIFRTFIWTALGIQRFCPRRGQVLQIPFRHNNMTIATPGFIDSAHRRGLHVHVWTVNDEATMRHLIDIGADGIVTDAPSLLLSVARELKKI